MLGHRSRLRENDDLPLRRGPVVKKKPPFSNARALITLKIMRSRDAQCILGNDLITKAIMCRTEPKYVFFPRLLASRWFVGQMITRLLWRNAWKLIISRLHRWSTIIRNAGSILASMLQKPRMLFSIVFWGSLKRLELAPENFFNEELSSVGWHNELGCALLRCPFENYLTYLHL